ncbi:MAG TPA: hypothetical protein VM938_04330 [Acidimicrobiales bacterium]|nr:hypothetical protein [Acidimicrobiales bacterium]
MYGFMELRTASSDSCRIEGIEEVRVESRGEARKSRVPADSRIDIQRGSPARLRVDWTPPGCNVPLEGQRVVVRLKGIDGDVGAPVDRPRRPECTADEVVSHLLLGSFERLNEAPPPMPSPARSLGAEIWLPPTAMPGEVLYFRVMLRNPTEVAIVLDPCPAFVIELGQNSVGGRRGVSRVDAYALNCTPVEAIDPGKTAEFRMEAEIPPETLPGDLRVSWRLAGPGIDVPTSRPRADQVGGFVRIP